MVPGAVGRAVQLGRAAAISGLSAMFAWAKEQMRTLFGKLDLPVSRYSYTFEHLNTVCLEGLFEYFNQCFGSASVLCGSGSYLETKCGSGSGFMP
jgi:hypothetical protein